MRRMVAPVVGVLMLCLTASVFAGQQEAVGRQLGDGGGNQVARDIENLKADGHRFGTIALFAQQGRPVASRADLRRLFSDGTVIGISSDQVRSILNQRVTQFTLPIPDGALELYEVDYSDLRVEGPNGEDLSSTNTAKHYRGIVQGDETSLAALSIFQNLENGQYEVAGVYRTSAGLSLIGRLKGNNPANEHVIYPQSGIINNPSSAVECGLTDETPHKQPRVPMPIAPDALSGASQAVKAPQAVAGACVRIHMEVEYDVYQIQGSNTTNYATGFFNIARTVYANESIPISLYYLRVWSSPDPEANVSGYQSIWNAFWNRMYSTGISGDLAMEVGIHIDRGIAALNPICGPDYNQAGISPIRDYPSYPTHSWASATFPHEIGHLMGSKHTQACAWNGNNTALDGCVAVEGSCARPSNTVGTIMSYCTFPLSNGFGSQPGNLIRSNFNNGTCLVSCGGTSCSYSISPSSASYAASGGSGSVSVTTSTGCSRTASSNVSWITITGGASGTGSGTVSYSVAANTATSARTGTATIAGNTFTVSQAGTGGTSTGTALSNGVAVSTSGATGSQTLYYIDVPSGASNLVMALSGGTGDADMHTRFGSAPTLTTYDCRPYASGNNETCSVAAPSAGRYYIMLHGYAAYSGASLRASFSTGTTPPPTGGLQVISPNGGEQWPRGSARTISWSKGSATRVDVALYRGTTFVQWITWNNANTSFSWTIPTSLAAGTNYKITIIDYNVRTVTDSSDSTFQIY